MRTTLRSAIACTMGLTIALSFLPVPAGPTSVPANEEVDHVRACSADVDDYEVLDPEFVRSGEELTQRRRERYEKKKQQFEEIMGEQGRQLVEGFESLMDQIKGKKKRKRLQSWRNRCVPQSGAQGHVVAVTGLNIARMSPEQTDPEPDPVGGFRPGDTLVVTIDSCAYRPTKRYRDSLTVLQGTTLDLEGTEYSLACEPDTKGAGGGRFSTVVEQRIYPGTPPGTHKVTAQIAILGAGLVVSEDVEFTVSEPEATPPAPTGQ